MLRRNGRGLNAFGDLACFQAGGADLDAFGDAFDHSPYSLQVRVPAAVGDVMGVGYIMAERRLFTTYCTYFRHGLSGILPKSLSVCSCLRSGPAAFSFPGPP